MASAFGFAFRSDHLLHPSGDPLFVVESGATLLRHPVVANVPAMRSMSGCGFRVQDRNVETVVRHPGLSSEAADYSTFNYFGDSRASGWDAHGPQRLAVAASFGRGRVVAFGDSTIFSNFTLHDEGRREWVLGALQYLARTNLLPAWHQRAARELGFLLGAFVVLAGLRRCRTPGPALASFLVAWAGGLAGAGLLKELAHPLPTTPESVHWARVWDGRPALDAELGPHRNLYLALARNGWTPDRIATLDESLDDARVLVVADPQRAPEPAEQRALSDYLRSGGRVLFVDYGGAPNEHARRLLNPLGIDLLPRLVSRDLQRAEPGSPIGELSSAAPLVFLDLGRFWSQGRPHAGAGPSSPLGMPLVEVVGMVPTRSIDGVTVAGTREIGRGESSSARSALRSPTRCSAIPR